MTPDAAFFNTPLWLQPTRMLNEQMAVGGFNAAAQTLRFLSCLRRGRGLVVNISCGTSQAICQGIYPVSFMVNKATLDRMTAALCEQLRRHQVFVLTLWPGNVKGEKLQLGAKRTGFRMCDTEYPKFSGWAIARLLNQPPEKLARL